MSKDGSAEPHTVALACHLGSASGFAPASYVQLVRVRSPAAEPPAPVGPQDAWRNLKAPWHEKRQPQTERCSISCRWLQVEKDEEYIKSIAALGGKVEELVKANNAIDIYQEYFSGRVSRFPSPKRR